MEIYNLVSFVGIFVLIGIAWLFSSDRRNINYRVIVWGLVLQITFALFVFVVPFGAQVFLYVNDIVVKILDSASAGGRFLFGRLALPPGTTDEHGETSLGFFLAFQAFPTIIFFSTLMSVLYFVNIMPRVVKAFSYVFTRSMRISGAESLNAASNIFVGIESVFTIRPYLNEMTRSELCTVLTACMATVSSNVLAIYVFTLQGQFPAIAGHLVSASILSAPAALLISKILLPESEDPKTLGVNVAPYYVKEGTLFETIINGAEAGVKLIVGIAALLIAILGLVALLDLIVGGIGGYVNSLSGIQVDWSLKGILGYVFYPFPFIMGVPSSDAYTISKIIGERVIVTEVVSYQDLAIIMGKGLLKHQRSAVITTYALCGFAHVASMAIFVGGISAIVPGRKRDIAEVALRSLVGATLACFMTACIAGTFFTDKSILLGN
ncbi:MAG TPA: nucleoside transporter C-terminal domain-containing protein [Thermodesulfobacteriota bacterium]|nr:nucleoside transporter C-terminal domain-containing protein [Thermodesulfobacteriota bacterium]